MPETLIKGQQILSAIDLDGSAEHRWRHHGDYAAYAHITNGEMINK
jgi:hypothetical protein